MLRVLIVSVRETPKSLAKLKLLKIRYQQYGPHAGANERSAQRAPRPWAGKFPIPSSDTTCGGTALAALSAMILFWIMKHHV